MLKCQMQNKDMTRRVWWGGEESVVGGGRRIGCSSQNLFSTYQDISMHYYNTQVTALVMHSGHESCAFPNFTWPYIYMPVNVLLHLACGKHLQ